MKVIRTLGISLIAGATVLTAGAASAQTSLQDVLNNARQERAAVAEQNRQREAEFLSERNTQQQKLSQIRGQVNSATAESDRLQAEFDANRAQIAELQTQLTEAQGEFAELFGAARSAATELAVQLQGSIISAQYPGRVDPLFETAQSETLPRIEELENLSITLLQEMTGQSEVVTFDAIVKTDNGEDSTRSVTRIGPFAAFSNGDFLVYKEGIQKLQFLARQPGAGANDAARRVENYSGNGYVAGVIDPSLGTLLELAVQRPSLRETIDQGGPVGYTILLVLAIAGAFGIFKLLSILGTSGAVRGQMRKKAAGKGNPLGRIMMAYQSNTSADVETLALKLDDAVLKEVPKLEGGLNLIKVAAAVAPLMGLLGTVIGMIRTFQAITLFGTGDPQIMAGGISEALVTTVLGLVAAIPLLLIHAFAAGSARSVTQVLEEQAAGMIAEHAESRS
ncbi:MotA/TolQ/ExbB proton channel family protein [Parvularcula sp. IMCC14364]|uniref:MotA/TolQ/ExbB proton channel family protein n=1 Tax=Parvularcula sp. IMCC14364 TaxID=3067902 RepID=UPI0027412F42|nr:MotA/TolQ/ExbB proton channel family protein [Parvularcula sp. IMCC14364]